MASNKPRMRSQALADTDDDVSSAGKGAARLAEADPDKMVLVEIDHDFTLTQDDGRDIKYKKGIDEMPLSHAMHWFSKAHGVKLYLGRRASSEQQGLAKLQAAASDKPPEGDPDKMPKEGIPFHSMSTTDVLGAPNLAPKI